MMSRRQGERGEGNLGCIIWALVVLIVGYVGYKTVPIKMSSAQLYDFMVEQAKDADRVPPADLKKRILLKAKSLDLPLAATNVSAERNGDRIRMKAKYTVPVDFGAGMVWQWEFSHDVDRPIFIF